MNIPEWMTRQAVAAGVLAALDLDGRAVSSLIPVADWRFSGETASASVTFGPYPQKVSATGVRLIVDDAVSVEPFDSLLTMPAGQTFRADVSIGVT